MSVEAPACGLLSRGVWSGSKRVVNFLGSLDKEVAKTTSGTLVYRFKISSFEKHCVLDLECRIFSQKPSDNCILYFDIIFIESKLKKISVDSW